MKAKPIEIYISFVFGPYYHNGTDLVAANYTLQDAKQSLIDFLVDEELDETVINDKKCYSLFCDEFGNRVGFIIKTELK